MAAKNTITDQTPPPRAAAFVAGGAGMVAVAYGLARYAYGLFLPRFEMAFHLGLPLLGLIASGSYLGYLFATSSTALMTARVGPRLPVTVGGLCAAVGLFLVAVARGPLELAVGVAIAGMSAGLVYPPYSDAVVQVVAVPQRERAYALINAGTSFGVILAGPAALWLAADWRLAWLLFAVLAGLVTLWNVRLVPARAFRRGGEERVPLALVIRRPGALRLFAVSLVVGAVASGYWTFAVEWLSLWVRGFSDATLFWTVVGVAGFAGAVAGDSVTRLGLLRALFLWMGMTAAAFFLLALWPQVLGLDLVSAALFGAGFVATTALLGVWSIHLFHERPSLGFGTTFFVVSLGQLVSPPLLALLGARLGLASVFWTAGVLSVVVLGLRPPTGVRGMTPEGPSPGVTR